MLRLSEVWAGYQVGASVIQGASLSVGDGEIVCILGRNGVGKTTLLRTIMGLIQAERGRIELDGIDLTRTPAHARARLGLGYTPQGRDLFPALAVIDNLRVAARGSRRHIEASVEAALEEFPMFREQLQARAATLSGGQQQLLALARAFASRPRMLLLDEPSEGIQPSFVDEILTKVKELNAKLGIAVLFVEQNLDFAASLAQRAYVMTKGRMDRELVPSAILSDEELQHEYMGV